MGAKFFCENCGALVDETEKSCPQCGLYFNAVRCPSCGFVGGQEDFRKGCPACGFLKPETGRGLQKQEIKPEKSRTEKLRKNKTVQSSGSLPFWVYLLILVLLLIVLGVILVLYFSLD